MELTKELKRIFCKNCNIPISIFIEPFFTERIQLFSTYFNSIEELKKFVKSIEPFDNEQDYYEHYNKVKNSAIDYIKSTKGYEKFNNMDMTEISKNIVQYQIKSSDIYKPANDGKKFISVDMKQANFHSLKVYSPDIFGHLETWEDFMRKFTDDEHIIGSRYIRQVILGNCNPKRHITYEKYLMSFIISSLIGYVSIEDIACYTNDEIVIRTDHKKYNVEEIKRRVETSSIAEKIPFKIEEFDLEYIGEIGYIKKYDDYKFKLKCVDNDYFPMILRLLQSNEVKLSDLFFMHKNSLARFDDIPDNIRKAFHYNAEMKMEVPIDQEETWRLIEVLDHNGKNKGDSAPLYSERMYCIAKNIRPRQVSVDGDYILCMDFIQNPEGQWINRHLNTSVVSKISVKGDILTIHTRNSVYKFQKVDVGKPDYLDEAGVIELWLDNSYEHFCKGIYYNKKKEPEDLTGDMHVGMFTDTYLIGVREQCDYGNYICRYYLGGNKIEFYDTIYHQQDYSERMIIHNTGTEPLQIEFEGYYATWTIHPGKSKSIIPFCADGADS